MTNDSLTTGLIGGVIGGVLGLLGGIVLAIEQRLRWRRENVAALRLLYVEVGTNRIALESGTAVASLGGLSVWQAQQVRVASSLNDADLNKVATAYTIFDSFLNTRALMSSDKAWHDWLKSDRGKEMATGRANSFRAAEAILVRALRRGALSAERRRWLGVSGGGLVRL